MIAIAITCLLVAAIILAMVSATDSLMRGWHSYGALAKELRTLRAMPQEPAMGMRSGAMRTPAIRPDRRPTRPATSAAARIRAAA